MMSRRSGIGTILGVAAATAALAAGVAATAGQSESHDGFGPDSPNAAGTTAPDWFQALMVRSDALNRKYGLGDYAPTPQSVTAPDWFEALMVRSDALNRKYRLGDYAPSSR